MRNERWAVVAKRAMGPSCGSQSTREAFQGIREEERWRGRKLAGESRGFGRGGAYSNFLIDAVVMYMLNSWVVVDCTEVTAAHWDEARKFLTRKALMLRPSLS